MKRLSVLLIILAFLYASCSPASDSSGNATTPTNTTATPSPSTPTPNPNPNGSGNDNENQNQNGGGENNQGGGENNQGNNNENNNQNQNENGGGENNQGENNNQNQNENGNGNENGGGENNGGEGGNNEQPPVNVTVDPNTIVDLRNNYYKLVQGSTVIGGDRFAFKWGSKNKGVFVEGRNVEVKSFWICDHEVTLEEWEEVMSEVFSKKRYWDTYAHFDGEEVAKLPVTGITFRQMLCYCNLKSIKDGLTPCYKQKKADGTYYNQNEVGKYNTNDGETFECDFTANGYRLPTEVEWEYAARGGKEGCKYEDPSYASSRLPKHWACYGNDGWEYNDNRLKVYIWSSLDSLLNHNATLHQVRLKDCDDLFLYDMNGNAAEVCWDWYLANTEITSSTPITGSSTPDRKKYHVYRGGTVEGSFEWCSNTSRGGLKEESSNSLCGFRVVLTQGQ